MTNPSDDARLLRKKERRKTSRGGTRERERKRREGKKKGISPPCARRMHFAWTDSSGLASAFENVVVASRRIADNFTSLARFRGTIPLPFIISSKKNRTMTIDP